MLMHVCADCDTDEPALKKSRSSKVATLCDKVIDSDENWTCGGGLNSD